MGKVVKCPVAPWEGNVEFSDPLTLPQALAWENAVRVSQEAQSRTEVDAALLPGVLACVEACEVEGLTGRLSVDKFPATPRVASAKLIAWLTEQVIEIYTGATVPNA